MLFADVVDVDKPGIFLTLGDATTMAYETIQIVVGDAQYEYESTGISGIVGVQRWCNRVQLVLVKWKAAQSSSAHLGQHDKALTSGINSGGGKIYRSVVSCQRYHQSRGALLFRSVRARVNSPPTPEYVPVGGGWPVEGLPMRQFTMHDVKSLPKLSKSASRLALIRQGYVGRIRTNKG